MPQFDFYSFASQVLWSAAVFALFYSFILKYYLVYFSEIYKMRNKLYQTQKLNNLDISSKEKIYSFLFFK